MLLPLTLRDLTYGLFGAPLEMISRGFLTLGKLILTLSKNGLDGNRNMVSGRDEPIPR